MNSISELDLRVHDLLVAHRTPWVSDLMRYVSDVAAWVTVIILVGLVAVWLLSRRLVAEAVFLMMATVGGQFLSSWLKSVFGRARPDFADHLVIVHSAAFPSGHSTQVVVTYGALAILLRRHHHSRYVKPIAVVSVFLLSVSVGVSRLYLGVHWPTDVLGGWLLGGIWLFVCWLTLRWLDDKRVKRLHQSD